jgi:hypothetical protein
MTMRGQSWDDYDKAGERGPLALGLKVIGCGIVLFLVLWGFGTAFGWFSEAATVAQEQVGARAALKKYEWFKDAAAQLDKKLADIAVYEGRAKDLESAYPGGRATMPRDEREEASVRATELAGVKASYNALAAEYNAASRKFNWRFAGGDALPHEYLQR